MADLADVVTCALAREVRDEDVVGVGLGTPLALCATLVAQRTHAPRATVLAGGAVSPRTTLREITHHHVQGHTPGFVPHLDTMDMAERQAMTLQFLRPAEVGPDGSANTSRLMAGERLVRFPGGLALADVVNLMPRIVLYHTAHERRALPAAVGFRTCAGGGIARGGYTALGPTKVITDRCVIAFSPGGPRLESIHPGEELPAVVAETGFALDASAAIETPHPTAEELAALAEVDPDRMRELELRKRRASTN